MTTKYDEQVYLAELGQKRLITSKLRNFVKMLKLPFSKGYSQQIWTNYKETPINL